jgi:serine-type D-Ala-D-Ala carboxypeptidase/endopeptidase (penicillin-binding protein 4)
MTHASVSFCISDAGSDMVLYQYNADMSLTVASVLKLVTTAAALEFLGSDYKFKTEVGYSGKIKNRKTLKGDVIIKGGGDPSLGSDNFPDQYNGFSDKWLHDFKTLGIKRITGRVIADDSYYDFEPVPGGWGWNDIGNYYGAGVYGLSVFDNTQQIHFKTNDEGSVPVITRIIPEQEIHFNNYLIASGSTDNGTIYLPPYADSGWISGTIPVNKEDTLLYGSIPDPPLLLAKMFNKKLSDAGIKIKGKPSTSRLLHGQKIENFQSFSQTASPDLTSLIEVLNHKSVNLYAEHLVKELGKKYRNRGSTAAGVEVVRKFLDSTGIKSDGMFIEDGSGLSARDAVSSGAIVRLLNYMKNNSRNYAAYFNSLPEAGKEGTLKNYFKDKVFESRLRAKSGSMSRVRSYAGYFTTLSGKEMAFCFLVNNYTGQPREVIAGIEDIIKEVIIRR